MSARKQSSESVGHIVAEETCSFGVRSGFQTFFQILFPMNFSKLPNFLEKKSLEKSLKNMVQPPEDAKNLEGPAAADTHESVSILLQAGQRVFGKILFIITRITSMMP
jgi:hypothetical protein